MRGKKHELVKTYSCTLHPPISLLQSPQKCTSPLFLDERNKKEKKKEWCLFHQIWTCNYIYIYIYPDRRLFCSFTLLFIQLFLFSKTILGLGRRRNTQLFIVGFRSLSDPGWSRTCAFHIILDNLHWFDISVQKM